MTLYHIHSPEYSCTNYWTIAALAITRYYNSSHIVLTGNRAYNTRKNTGIGNILKQLGAYGDT